MSKLQVPVPGGQDFHITRSGREFSEFSGPSSSVSGREGENLENLGAGVGSTEAVLVESLPTAENRGANGQWANFEASEASRVSVGPNFSGGMGPSVGLESASRTTPALEFSGFLNWMMEEKKREMEEKLARSTVKVR